MRQLAAVALIGLLTLLGAASSASAVTITNDTVTLGVNPQGDLNDLAADAGLTYNDTGNDGTIASSAAEGWGAGADGPLRFEGRANEQAGNDGYAVPVTFTSNATEAVSVVDILRDGAPALRLTQNFHPSPATPYLYEITTTLENLSDAPLTDVRYERVVNWQVEPTVAEEFVTINRGPTPPSRLIYSDDNGIGDNLPFSDKSAGTLNGPIDASTVDASYVDRGPADHGARFTFALGDLGAGESRRFFLYYGAAGDEAGADAAVSSAALELFSYGQPNVPDGDDEDTLADGPEQGKPTTFIAGFRGVGGSAVIPPTLSLTPDSGSSTAGGSHALTATLTNSGGTTVPGASIIFAVDGANATGGAGTTDANGQAGFAYTGGTAGDDTITACLDANDSGACDPAEITDTATKHWDELPPPPAVIVDAPPIVDPPAPVEPAAPSPAPEIGETVVAGAVSGTVRVKDDGGGFRSLRATQPIPVGSMVDATKGTVRLTSAANTDGATQTAEFYQGSFRITQTRGSRPITELALTGKLSCPTRKKGSRATASARRKKVRRLWGEGKGRFRTKGRYGAATVKGTKWLTEDRCGSTLVRVKRGRVSVRDAVKRKTVLVTKGHSYAARAKKR
jgi:hypothetical protein